MISADRVIKKTGKDFEATWKKEELLVIFEKKLLKDYEAKLPRIVQTLTFTPKIEEPLLEHQISMEEEKHH